MILFVCAVIAPVKTRMDQQKKRFFLYLPSNYSKKVNESEQNILSFISLLRRWKMKYMSCSWPIGFKYE